MWNREKITNLIELVRERECLWNVNNTEYRSQTRRRIAHEEIAAILEIPLKEVKRKLHTLRAQYSKETGKIRRSEAGERKSYSRWEYYDQLKFMFAPMEETASTDSRLQIEECISHAIEMEDIKLDQHLDTNLVEMEVYPSTSCSNVHETRPSPSSPGTSPSGQTDHQTALMQSKNKRKNSALDEKLLSTCWDILSEKKARDEFSIFGEFVASEMRLMKDRPDLVFSLKHKIQRLVLETSEMFVLNTFGHPHDRESSTY